MRKIYLDNIRWATVLLVLIYHVCYMFNGLGILGGIPHAKNIAILDTFAAIVYPWFMVLLFIVAGMSARYSLQKRGGKLFIRERVRKLLLPSTLGLLILHWISGYMNIMMGGGLEYIPKALIYPISVISGIGPLWFIQMLFLFSYIFVLIQKIDSKDRLWKLCENADLMTLLLLFILILGSAQILNMPVLIMYRFGIYFTSFLIGCYVFSHDKVQETIEKWRLPMLVCTFICAVIYILRYNGCDYTASACLQSIITNLYLWFAVLAVIGYAKRYFNEETAFSRYMTNTSFGIYILHYPILIIICYVLHNYFDFAALWNYLFALTAEIILTFAGYEVIKRIPLIRYFVFGIKGKTRQENDFVAKIICK